MKKQYVVTLPYYGCVGMVVEAEKRGQVMDMIKELWDAGDFNSNEVSPEFDQAEIDLLGGEE